jgi:4-hydroxy-tetrahydrodipicolinate synthase
VARLTADDVFGIWEGVTLSWTENYKLDEKTYSDNIKRTLSAGVHGVYTTGSTGEFYALEHKEFCAMVDIQAELCGKAGMPLQIGCCSDATAKTVKLVEYAAGKSQVGAVQVVIPYWMELTDRELCQFFKDLYAACPDMPMIHYNIPRSKRFLNGEDYLRILEVAPNLIGVKYTFAGAYFAQLQDSIITTPNLSYFVAENMLVSAMQVGARGSYSSLVATNPSFVLDMYGKAKSSQWDEAIKMQKHICKFLNDAESFITKKGEGTTDPVFDKGLSIAAGYALGHQRCRPPYIGWTNDTVREMRKWLQGKYPEFIYPC